MLTLVRALGFLAPLAVTLCALVVATLAGQTDDQEQLALLAPVILAALAGMTSMALVAWAFGGWRLARIAGALEETLRSDGPIRLKVTGVPAERRLAMAFNRVARAFLQVEARASHDRLTGVPNRETLMAALVAEIHRSVRYHKPLSVAFFDIDRFKPINDTHGHTAGDAVLRQVAALVADNLRSSDVMGRYGGEEFMVILPETTPDDALGVAEQIRNLVMTTPMTIPGGQRLGITVSVGVAGGLGEDLKVDRLVEHADAAMYAAKSLGRNRTYLFRGMDDDAPVRRAPISPEHRQAAVAIGQWASATATQALASILAPEPHHRGGPSDMIAALATGLAVELELPPDEIERVRVASLLHDLGKVAVPTEILDKRASVAPGEWRTVGEHPRIGQMILEHASSLRDAIPIVLHHHERFNGGGYPYGLRGAEIPIGARIVAVADAYHAMVHDRPYKDALSHEEALAELEQHAGTQFDPQVVRAFVELYRLGVPSDGMQELYRLHDRAEGAIQQLNPSAARLSSLLPTNGAAAHHPNGGDALFGGASPAPNGAAAGRNGSRPTGGGSDPPAGARAAPRERRRRRATFREAAG